MRVVELFGSLLSLVGWRDLAQMCGVDRTTVTRWVAGTTSVPHAVIRLLELMLELKELNGRCRVYWNAPAEMVDVP